MSLYPAPKESGFYGHVDKLNGVVVNVITDISVGEGNIGFQAEYAEIFLRNIVIKEFEEPVALETFMEF